MDEKNTPRIPPIFSKGRNKPGTKIPRSKRVAICKAFKEFYAAGQSGKEEDGKKWTLGRILQALWDLCDDESTKQEEFSAFYERHAKNLENLLYGRKTVNAPRDEELVFLIECFLWAEDPKSIKGLDKGREWKELGHRIAAFYGIDTPMNPI